MLKDMKRMISNIYKAVILALALTAAACTPEMAEEKVEGLALKSYMPTSVLAGAEMLITGNNLDEVVSVVFPDNVEVTDFELITNEQIRLVIPSGIAQEGGKLTLVSADRKVESKVAMRLARPAVLSLDPGDEIKPGKVLTIKGEDMEYVTKVIFPGAKEGNVVTIESMDFLRKSPDNVKVTVPEGIYNGTAKIKVQTLEGKILESPEINIASGPSDEDWYIVCKIQSAAAEMFLTRNPGASTPIIQAESGNKDQEFTFVPIKEEKNTYYLKNNATGEYLSIGEEYEWRMGWYADPSAAPKPENAKFQVSPIAGTDFYEIHVLGSVDLGLDSTGDWSEVYSNKYSEYGTMYQWVIHKISGPQFGECPEWVSNETFIWEGEVYIEWSGMTDLSWGAYDWSTVAPGTVLTAHVILSPNHDYWQIRFAKGDGWSSIPTGMELGDNIPMEAGTTEFGITLSEADLDELVNRGGLVMTGTNYTLTGLSLK